VRIALFSETSLPQRNGVALILDRLIRHLTAQGHEVLLAVPVSWRPRGEAPAIQGLRIVRVPGIPLPRYPDLTLALPLAARVLRAVAEFRPDIIHLVTEYSLGLTGLQAAVMLGVPAIASFHTNIPRYLPYYGFGWADGLCWDYLRWFHNQACVTFCPSETNRTELLARGFRNVRVWPRGVDTQRFSPLPRPAAGGEPRGGAAALRLLYVGRLTPEKDLHVLFDAYERVRSAHPSSPVHLTLVGDGAYTGVMRARAPRDVTFAGYLEGEALSAAYAAADVFVFPSRSETLGNVVLEALASGLPVVGVRDGGTLENVRDGVNGVLCEPGDAGSFAEGILRLARDPDLCRSLGANARAWAEQRTWEAAFAPLTSTYVHLAGR
jgi:glycosyltransferase involved in cell wall biosynthesis